MTHLLCHPAAFYNTAGMLSEQRQHANIKLHTRSFVLQVNAKRKMLLTFKMLLSLLLPNPLKCIVAKNLSFLIEKKKLVKSLIPDCLMGYICLLYKSKDFHFQVMRSQVTRQYTILTLVNLEFSFNWSILFFSRFPVYHKCPSSETGTLAKPYKKKLYSWNILVPAEVFPGARESVQLCPRSL